ncbi:MAG: DegT/DnrJ/EryC1/StrS family aminotransferase [Candidatus Latescibacteria bacterium]|nr:DegT/DnrJ/EryC1/StrS family aminotransferase [Candidatus Latescibacterota bacterium]
MLAIDGGPKVRTTPFPKRHLLGAEEKAAAVALFDRAMETGDAIGYGGPEEQAYEREFAQFMGGGYADLVNSGSSALYVALGALELAPAGEVIVPPITDPGGVMPVALLNLVPVVADAHPGSFNSGAEQIAAVLTPHTRAIVVAHIAGEPAEMDAILALAAARGLPVIEDCAQSHGARYQGRLVGSLGAIAAFSTMSGKHHATGPQGGVVYTADEQLYWRAKRFSDRGKPFNTDSPSNVRAGLNLNGNDLAAAVGRVQLRKLAGITQRRRQVAGRIIAGLGQLQAVRAGWEAPQSEGVYWFMRLRVEAARLKVDKDTFARAVAAEGIPVTASYRHLPSEARWFRERLVFPPSDYPWGLPAYQGDRQAQFPCPNAVEAAETHFVLAVHENYTDQEVTDILAALRKVEDAYLK